MRVVKGYKGRILDVQVFQLRDEGYTSHFSIVEDRGSEMLETYFQTGQRFATHDDALTGAFWLAANKIEKGYEPHFNKAREE